MFNFRLSEAFNTMLKEKLNVKDDRSDDLNNLGSQPNINNLLEKYSQLLIEKVENNLKKK